MVHLLQPSSPRCFMQGSEWNKTEVLGKNISWVHVLRAVSTHLFWKLWPVSRKTGLWKHALITETDRGGCIRVKVSDNVCCIYVPLNFPRLQHGFTACHILVPSQMCFLTRLHLAKLIYFTLRGFWSLLQTVQYQYPTRTLLCSASAWFDIIIGNTFAHKHGKIPTDVFTHKHGRIPTDIKKTKNKTCIHKLAHKHPDKVYILCIMWWRDNDVNTPRQK